MYQAKFTVGCHLAEVVVKPHQRVKRGEVIGYMGSTGTNVTHLHYEVTIEGWPHGDGKADLDGTFVEDPMKYIIGCFDPNKKYPNDEHPELVLTAPIPCGPSKSSAPIMAEPKGDERPSSFASDDSMN